MDLLAKGAEWLHEQRHAQLSSPVVYRRGGTGAGIALQATTGRTAADQLTETELATTAGIRDYLFRTSDFEVLGQFVPPALRDTITDDDGTRWQVVEIGGEPCWRYSDGFKNAVRVHTVKD